MAGRVGRRVYKTVEWRRVRAAVLRRDGWRCQTCGRRTGLEVHHLRPISKAGDWYALDNLEAICRGCHIRETAEGNRRKVTGARAELRAMATGG